MKLAWEPNTVYQNRAPPNLQRGGDTVGAPRRAFAHPTNSLHCRSGTRRPNSGLSEFGNVSAQVGSSRLGWRGRGIRHVSSFAVEWIRGSTLTRRPGMTTGRDVGLAREDQRSESASLRPSAANAPAN